LYYNLDNEKQRRYQEMVTLMEETAVKRARIANLATGATGGGATATQTPSPTPPSPVDPSSNSYVVDDYIDNYFE